MLQTLTRDFLAGAVVSLTLIANIVSFAALMFTGELSAGVPVAVWALLVGSCIGGLWIAASTSLPPLATGIDSPTGALLVIVSGMVGSAVLAAGGSTRSAIDTTMLAFSIVTLLSGALFLGFGIARRGPFFRFVPYSVVGGFLAATGCLLIAGGIKMTTGVTFSNASAALRMSAADVARLVAAVGALGVLLAVRRVVKSPYAIPLAILVMIVVGNVALALLGRTSPQSGWYMYSPGTLEAWRPLTALRRATIDWAALLHVLPEIFATMAVATISLVTKVSSVEVARAEAGDLDREFRAHGVANLLMLPFGGVTASMQIGSSRLLEQAGGATRWSGAACALVFGLVALLNIDLPGLIPTPIAAALVFLLGWSFLADSLRRPILQRTWLDLSLALAIMLVCLRFGYIVGVVAGVFCACLLFAISYGRIGVVRRHASRALAASSVDRSLEDERTLRREGEAIQIYWLSGYIFFGSSDRVFERIRQDIDARADGAVRFMIVDFSGVTGADTSAFMSLMKLKSYCDRRGITLACAAIASPGRAALERDGFVGPRSRHRLFPDRDAALEWCEDQLLAARGGARPEEQARFELWLKRELASAAEPSELLAHFARKSVAAGQVVYTQGEASDSIDFIAAGTLSVIRDNGDGTRTRLRRIATHSVIGEMGFFRRTPRTATVIADEDTVLFSLSRESFQRLREGEPKLAGEIYDFIIRVLADRLDFANSEVASLAG
ncbi:MAG: SulP family inorganic anion transporter [Hyphomicrobiaceae bacterium]|nr:SulP family inorganic anion transporter [Hyphomicrobiaceae bacterium]